LEVSANISNISGLLKGNPWRVSSNSLMSPALLNKWQSPVQSFNRTFLSSSAAAMAVEYSPAILRYAYFEEQAMSV
jgi:hypothetical protein